MMNTESAHERDVELIKTVALHEMQALGEVRQTLLGQHAEIFKWLTASLLAINGGAAVATLSSEYLSIVSKLWAGGAFSAGVLFALLVGVFTQRSNQSGLPIVQAQVGYWLSVAADGERDEKFDGSLKTRFSKALRLGLAGQICGWLAALSFVVGVFNAGTGLTAHSEQTDVGSMQVDRSSHGTPAQLRDR